MENIQHQIISCDGGLVLNRDTFTQPPGTALQLQNFEPSIEGGYRRVSGTEKFTASEFNDTNLGTTSKTGSGAILMSAVFGSTVIAARGAVVGKSSGLGWTKIDESRTSANKYTFDKYNFTGTDKIIFADGQNYAATYDGTNYVLLNGAAGAGSGTAPTATESVAVFRNHVFFAKSSSQEITFSAPFSENDFTTANGAGSLSTGDKVIGLAVFRERLFIFCRNSIWVLRGTNVLDFALESVTRNIGCLDKFSIQEIGGDIIFLAPDGLRTIAGTEKIADIELGSISKPIQERVNGIGFDNISSLVIREKSQYRIFYPTTSGVETSSKGIIGTIKQSLQGDIGWQFADMLGIKPSCADSGFNGTTELVAHGGYDGFVYKQEAGSNFSGTNIKAFFRSPDIIIGDAGIRKSMQRVISNYKTEGSLTAELRVRYDYDSPNIPQPAAYAITTGAGAAIYGSSGSTYGVSIYGSSGVPLIRQSVEGGGFAVAIKFDEAEGSSPFTLNGFQLEYTAGGRH